MTKRPTFKEFKKECLKDPEFRAAYEALRPEFELIRKQIKARIKARKASIAPVKLEEIEDVYFGSIAHKSLQEEDEYITHSDVKKKLARKR